MADHDHLAHDEHTPLLPPLVPTSASASKPGESSKAAEPAHKVKKSGTNGSWGDPAGLPPRGPNDENLVIFRRALGINTQLPSSADDNTLEEGRKSATGIYRDVLRTQRARAVQTAVLNVLVYACHFAQIVISAVLTALGPNAAAHPLLITVLGGANTVVAGALALLRGQGLPERLHRDEVEYRRIQDWIEETEALLAVGVVGRDRQDVGVLVEAAFRKYNAAKASAENNKPDNYVRQREEGAPDVEDDSRSTASGNAMVRLRVKGEELLGLR